MVKKRSGRATTSNRNKSEDKGGKLVGEDVMVLARDRLKGALQGLIDPTDDESSSSADERTISPPLPLSMPVTRSTPVKREPRQLTRRRRKKPADQPDQVFHHTFVMKLFDRSVDLAQFTDETPLYPICRAWMANQPRSSQEGQNSTNDSSKKAKLENGSPETSVSKLDVSTEQDVYELPPPVGSVVSRIPVREHKTVEDVTFDTNMTKNQLLSEHMQRWTEVRRTWIQAAQDNEARYEDSGKILSDMFKNSQKSYNL